MRASIAFLVFAVIVAVAPCSAGEPATAESVRSAATRALPYIAGDGQKWMREKGCITCHQVPSMVWSFNIARERGLAVDAGKLKLWNTWAVDNGLKRATYYKVTDAALSKLREAKVADESLLKLGPIKDQNFVSLEDFRDALASKLSAVEVKDHDAELVKACAVAGQGGGGGGSNNQYTFLLMSQAPRGSKDPRADARALATALAESQTADGSWVPAGQFKMQQRSADEAMEVVTLWSVLALAQASEPTAEETAAAKKAREWLKSREASSAQTNTSIEKLMLQAMLARHDGDDATAKKLTDELLKLQHADGGWGWLKDRKESDLLTTGEVLYGLSYLGRDGKDAAVRKAWQYLLAAQDKDGKWPFVADTISASKKPDRKDGDYIYTYWTTAWAVIGMLSTLPD